MAQHKCTMSNWTNDGKTWLWMTGLEEELETLKVEALGRWPGRVECGLPEPVSGSARGPRSRWTYYMAFVFQDANDAMLFKLSN